MVGDVHAARGGRARPGGIADSQRQRVRGIADRRRIPRIRRVPARGERRTVEVERVRVGRRTAARRHDDGARTAHLCAGDRRRDVGRERQRWRRWWRRRCATPLHVVEAPAVVLIELFAAGEIGVQDATGEHRVTPIAVREVTGLLVDPRERRRDDEIEIRRAAPRREWYRRIGNPVLVPERLVRDDPGVVPQPVQRRFDRGEDPAIPRLVRVHDEGLGGEPEHERLDVVLARGLGGLAEARAAKRSRDEPLIEVAERLIDELGQARARRGADFLGVDVAHDRVRDLAAQPRRDRLFERRRVDSVRGMFGQRHHRISRRGVACPEVIHREAVGEVPIPRHTPEAATPAWRAHDVLVAIDRRRALRARQPGAVAGVLGDLLERALGVVIDLREVPVEAVRLAEILTRELPVAAHVGFPQRELGNRRLRADGYRSQQRDHDDDRDAAPEGRLRRTTLMHSGGNHGRRLAAPHMPPTARVAHHANLAWSHAPS